jgi:tRNA-modifying protein YgfZ
MVSLTFPSVNIRGISTRGDYLTLTERCGLFDRSERGKLALAGADAKPFLQGQVTNDVEALVPGAGCYAAFLTPKGKMLGDLRILDAGDELLLDTERIALQALFNMIRRFAIGYDAQLHKRTVERGLLSLIGPRSTDVLRAAAGGAGGVLPGKAEHTHGLLTLVGCEAPVRAIRTDIGIDLLCDSGELDLLRGLLLEAGAAEVTDDAAECLRVERGRPRYGVDLDETVIPQEAGLNERAVSFTKGCYVGQETVARLFYRGKPNRRLCGLLGSGPLAPGMQIIYEDRTAGRVTSAAESPRFGAIALALVRREAPLGAFVSLGPLVGAELVELPFA